ncbi:EAL domain-containing protein [Thioalkalivibrio sp. ALMg11]|uniref:EAL domain-containing protein n=1 Tax=Thioalkalivibrio sp. ALMg11 TaxID=1158165 RepID=UPI000370E938|nr:EAL domain-containing protein [Thioalkalivibrio sp. ALMg11]
MGNFIDSVGTHSVLFQPIAPLPWQLSTDVEYYELLSRVQNPGGWEWRLEELFACPDRTLKVDFAVMAQAVLAARTRPNECFGINVAPSSLIHPEYLPRLTAAVQSLPSPENLVIEITESFDASEAVLFSLVAAVERIAEMGVKTALDDFGTGGAGLAIFSMAHFDYVKFAPVVDVTSDRGRAVLESVADTANRLGDFSVILEGVETQDMLDVANDCGAFFAQGYHVGRPAERPIPPQPLRLSPRSRGGSWTSRAASL